MAYPEHTHPPGDGSLADSGCCHAFRHRDHGRGRGSDASRCRITGATLAVRTGAVASVRLLQRTDTQRTLRHDRLRGGGVFIRPA
ncbi:MAG: hypothetical protein ABF504_14840, partial [Komagataeibacter saccharivorans]|uniref:hypothetical protein n=1 Tax=Komagataeibacter saccharivorans TaxID=265959 RepID=UPI0039E796B4